MIWPTNTILEALRVYLWPILKAGGTDPIGLKMIDLGDWEIPAPASISDMLPALVLVAPDEEDEQPDASGTIDIEGVIEVNFLRLLAPTERKNFAIREDSAKIKKALSRKNPRGLPGWPSADAAVQAKIAACKFAPARSWVAGSNLEPGFFAEDPPLDIEHEIIRFRYKGGLFIP